MKHLLIVVWLLLSSNWANAQLHDAQWVLGPATSVLDFREDTLAKYTIDKWMNTKLASASYSSSDGNLLYYTNGIFVADKNGDPLSNGSGISPCSFSSQYEIHGLPIQQAVIFLPAPNNLRYCYLFHFSGDTSGSRPGTFYYSLIDGEKNFGLGEVTDKNHVFHKEIYRGGGMTACKHANGRDWWIVMGRANTNRFYTFLLTPNGISDTVVQDIGPIYNGPFDNAYSCFSEDGSKYVTGAYGGYITVLDFDRCTGEFSNPIAINNTPLPATASGSSSVAFSPNGRFVYAADRLNLTQYDLWATDVQDSVEIYRTDSGDYAQMSFLELGPNGKLYCSTWNGGFYFLHVVNKPDEKGDSCNFLFGGQPTLSANSFNLPNMPNYRLGPLVGSGCDTIETGLINAKNRAMVRIQPNPANKYLYAEMPMQGNYVFELVNEAGQWVERKETRQVDIINTETLPNGIYFLKVSEKNHSNPTITKVAVQH